MKRRRNRVPIVPPWTAAERDQVLASKGVTGANLQPAVASSLLNPRLLGIALTLLEADTLENLESLSVTWLLFEHLRMLDRERSDGHSAMEFAALLQGHAKDILTRVRSEVADDLNRLRFARLDACGNDQELALEAATAIYANKDVIPSST